MNDRYKLFIHKAKDSLFVAKNNLEIGHPGYAVSRAYYSMFYMA